MRIIRRRGLKGVPRRRQRDVLRDVMLSATECETWLTLDALANLPITRPPVFPRSCGTCESRNTEDSLWKNGPVPWARPCAVRISARFGNISSRREFARLWAGIARQGAARDWRFGPVVC